MSVGLIERVLLEVNLCKLFGALGDVSSEALP